MTAGVVPILRLLLVCVAWAGGLGVLAGCPVNTPPYIECIDETSCGLAPGGQCIANPGTGHRFCAYPDQSCPDGLRWSDLDVEQPISGECVAVDSVDAGIDAGGDAVIDAIDAMPTQAAFALGVVSEWRIGGEPASMSGTDWIRVVNTGTAPLDLATAQITNVAIGDSRFQGTATWTPVTTLLSPGNSAGALSPAAAQLIVSSGLVTEPVQSNSSSLVTLRLTTIPPSGVWLVVDIEITVQIGNARATVPTRVVLSGASPAAVPYAAQRVSSAPVP